MPLLAVCSQSLSSDSAIPPDKPPAMRSLTTTLSVNIAATDFSSRRILLRGVGLSRWMKLKASFFRGQRKLGVEFGGIVKKAIASAITVSF